MTEEAKPEDKEEEIADSEIDYDWFDFVDCLYSLEGD
jgi:hypothetical protein